MTAAVSILLHELRLDGGMQARAAMCQATVDAYMEALDQLPPVTAFHDDNGILWLADGFHRVEAARRAGRDMLVGVIHDGSQRDAVLHAVGANAEHGLPRTRADKHRAVERLLEDAEWSVWSDRAIARAARVTHPFVATVRARHTAPALEAGRSNPSHDTGARQPGGNVSTQGDSYQAPEPDNAVRTPVQREHKGKQLAADDHAAMRALRTGGWSREALGERFRVELHEVDRILKEQAPPQDGTPAAGERDIAQDQWWTPAALAQVMVELAGVQPGDHVLEPSAGSGAIVEALLAAGATVEAHEKDPRWAAYLRICGRHEVDEDPRWMSGQVDLYEGDYLASPPPAERVWPDLETTVQPRRGGARFVRAVINPPYKDGLDGLFLARALEEADHVVALLRVNALCGQDRYRRVWEKHGGRCTKVLPLVIRPDFTGSDRGSEGNGAKSDFVVLVFGAEDLGERAPMRHLTQRFGGGL